VKRKEESSGDEDAPALSQILGKRDGKDRQKRSPESPEYGNDQGENLSAPKKHQKLKKKKEGGGGNSSRNKGGKAYCLR